jgi:hypothetical protein
MPKKTQKNVLPGRSKNGFDGFDESQQKFQVHLTFMVDIKRHFGLWMVKGIPTFWIVFHDALPHSNPLVTFTK